MKMRTRIQEMKFGQALGYAWGVKDYSRATKDLILESAAFATFYSMLEELRSQDTFVRGVYYGSAIQDAYKYFRELTSEEQKEYATLWQRRPWSMYEEMENDRA